MALNTTLAAGEITKRRPLSEKEKAAIYFEARTCALANARLTHTKLTRKAERDIEEALTAWYTQTPSVLPGLVKNHDAYLSCPSYDAQNVFVRSLVDKRVQEKTDAAVYLEAHVRALAFARRYKDTNVRQFERRLEEELRKDAKQNPSLLKEWVENHNAYLACPTEGARNVFTKKLVDEKVDVLNQSVRNVSNVQITYSKQNPIRTGKGR